MNEILNSKDSSAESQNKTQRYQVKSIISLISLAIMMPQFAGN